MATQISDRPQTVKWALVLVVVLILYRVGLIFGAVQGLAEAASSPEGLPGFGSQFAFPVAGRLGNPLLLFLLIPVLIIARRLMRRGHTWAMLTYRRLSRAALVHDLGARRRVDA